MIIGQVDKKGPARDRPLEGLKVVVNAGNGMGGFLVDTLAEVRGGLYVLGLHHAGKSWQRKALNNPFARKNSSSCGYRLAVV